MLYLKNLLIEDMFFIKHTSYNFRVILKRSFQNRSKILRDKFNFELNEKINIYADHLIHMLEALAEK